MNGRHRRVFRVMALVLTAAAVVVPVTGAAAAATGPPATNPARTSTSFSAMTALIGAEDVVAIDKALVSWRK